MLARAKEDGDKEVSARANVRREDAHETREAACLTTRICPHAPPAPAVTTGSPPPRLSSSPRAPPGPPRAKIPRSRGQSSRQTPIALEPLRNGPPPASPAARPTSPPQEAAKKALQESLSGMFRGKDILADFDGPKGGGGGGGGGGSGGGWDGWFDNWRDPEEWKRGGADALRAAGGFVKELWATVAAIVTFLAVVWSVGNLPQLVALAQFLVVKALRIDGGSKRARLEQKVKAAAGGAGRDSLGVAESAVTAKWNSDDEGDEDEDYGDEE